MFSPLVMGVAAYLMALGAEAPRAQTQAQSQVQSKSPSPSQAHLHRPAPLQRLSFSARQGFSLRMIGNEEVTAEIRNGAGRTLAKGSYSLQAGDWKLCPRNLAPGLYTIWLRTGTELRAMRMNVSESDRGKGSPEWLLEKVESDSSAASPAVIAPSKDF